MKGLIFSIKRYSIHDGPGIRVSFFMKGCPLSCWWCHNPEGIYPDPEIVEESHRIGEKVIKRKENAGKYYSADDLLRILERERIFMTESNGGVTFSGGEPLYQFDFLLEALRACRANGFILLLIHLVIRRLRTIWQYYLTPIFSCLISNTLTI
jgi:pyruvate formate lyase activating enzyme